MPHQSTSTALGDRTIVAIITPPGQGGIAAIRLAGPEAAEIAAQHFRSTPGRRESSIFRPWVLRHAYLCRANGDMIDEVTAVYMPPGRSYTGEEQVEIFCHGGLHVVRLIQEVLIESGAQSAEPGEFTKLAFLNGRIDLTRAEGVADIVAALTDQSYRAARQHLSGNYSSLVARLRSSMLRVAGELEAAIDFPEEDVSWIESGELSGSIQSATESIRALIDSYEAGRLVRDGFRIAIAGPPNAGKSSLLNLLLRRERALVTATPGTTRDYISEWIDLEGFAVELTDTAGIRETEEEIERAGQEAARRVFDRSHLIIWMADLSAGSFPEDIAAGQQLSSGKPIIMVGNKIDIVEGRQAEACTGEAPDVLMLSCKTAGGLGELREAIRHEIERYLPDQTDGIMVTSARHVQCLRAAHDALDRAGRLLEASEATELPAFEVNSAVKALDEITGRIYNEEVLEEIFSRFCIGK